METNEKIIAIVGITEAIKQYGVPSEFCPSVAILVGALFGYTEKPNAQGILEGVILGATVTGGYALTKKTGRGILSPFANKSVKLPNNYENLEADDYRGV